MTNISITHSVEVRSSLLQSIDGLNSWCSSGDTSLGQGERRAAVRHQLGRIDAGGGSPR